MAIGNLDYKPAKLSIEVTNPVEESYRMHACAKESWTVDFIEAIQPGAVFWDVGANTGPYTLIAAHRNLTTIAIEPGFNNYAALCRNLAMNNLLDRCVTLCLALGAQSGFAWLDYSDMRQGAASHKLGETRKQHFHRQLIPVWAWDELEQRLPLPADRPQFAKIDVDGNELAVLKGAPGLLANPLLQGLIVEMHADTEAEITALLGQAGLRLAARFDERNGQSIGDIAYGRFERGS